MRPYSFLYLAPCLRRRPVTCHAPRALRVWSARGRCCAGIGRSCVGSGGRRPARADARLRRPRCGPSCCGWLARSATSTPRRRVPSWPPDRARARRGQGAAPHRTSDLDGAREPAPTLAASTGTLDIEASVVAVVRRSSSGDGEQQGDLLALLEALRRPACTPPITGSTERSAGARSGSLSRRRARRSSTVAPSSNSSVSAGALESRDSPPPRRTRTCTALPLSLQAAGCHRPGIDRAYRRPAPRGAR